MEAEVKRFVNFISVFAVVTAVAFFIVGMARGRPFLFCFVNGFVIVIVANIPEGLPATVTSLLSIAARRLSARHILVKDTGIIESLGSCTARPPAAGVTILVSIHITRIPMSRHLI